MDSKDIAIVIISSAALIVSLSTLAFSIRQKVNDNRRNIRKTLTDIFSTIVDISIKTFEKKAESKNGISRDTIDTFRVYNMQRRSLVNHADFLMRENPKLVTEIDWVLLANSCQSIGDFQKADECWRKAIEMSEIDPIRLINLRGYASFLFFQGSYEEGRKQFGQAVLVSLKDSDNARQIKADTYLIWATVEKEFGFNSQIIDLLGKSQETSQKISHTGMKSELLNRIANFSS